MQSAIKIPVRVAWWFGAFVLFPVPGVVIRLVCGLLLFNSASGNGTALGHGWGSHAVDCTSASVSQKESGGTAFCFLPGSFEA